MHCASDNKEIMLKKAELLLRQNEINQAKDILNQLLLIDKSDNEVLFDMGSLCLVEKKYYNADLYFKRCIDNGYTVAKVYYNAAICKEKLKDNVLSEEYFTIAYKSASEEYKPFFLIALFDFYMRISNFMNAERVSYRYIKTYPQEYQGHHMFFLALLNEKDYAQAETHFIEIRDSFEEEPGYWLDRMFMLYTAGKFSAILEMINHEPIIMKVNSNDALRFKTKVLLMRKNNEDAEKSIRALYESSKTIDIAYSMMLIEFLNENYVEAGNISNSIMKTESNNPGIFYHLAAYFQTIILYRGYNNDLPNDVLDYILNTLYRCIKWFKSVGFTIDEMIPTLAFFTDMKIQRSKCFF